MVAGVGRALDAIEAFRFDDETLAALEHGSSTSRRCDWLADYRFGGDVWGYAEGEVYFPYSPLLIVEASFAEAVLLETVLLSIYNHDSAIASAASRMTCVAGEPAVHRDGLAAHPRGGRGGAPRGRRTSPASRPPPTCAAAAALRRPHRRHQRALLHAAARHRGATRSARRCSSLGQGTTLLVDTYDVAEAVRLGVEVAGPGLGAVRLDSGDLGVLAAAGPRASSTRSAPRAPGSS